MISRLNTVLERVLSQEIANQEIWLKDDLEQFNEDVFDRESLIQEIKDFMNENNIRFNRSFYEKGLI